MVASAAAMDLAGVPGSTDRINISDPDSDSDYPQSATVVDLHRLDVSVIKNRHEGRESPTFTYSKAIWVILPLATI